MAHLTSGHTTGTTIVRVTAADISQPVQFTATIVLPSAPVDVLDSALHTEIMSALGKSRDGVLTIADMLNLTTLTANNANISSLIGLQHASNLTTLSLDDNNISDVAPLAGLSQLIQLSLNNNNISDVAPLAALTRLKILSLNNNNILDVSSLETLTHLQTLHLKGNPLKYPSLHTSIPTIQANGATVTVRTPTTLVKLSGARGVAGAIFWLPIEVQDEEGFGIAGVPVTLNVIAGGGSLDLKNYITDGTGRVRIPLTLGATPGKNTIQAVVPEVLRPVSFTIIGVDSSSPVTVRDTNLRAKIVETLSKQHNVQLTAGDMLALTQLGAPNANIQDLTGLEHAHNLNDLNLNGEYISGEGWVNSNRVSDFSPLFGLAQLGGLRLTFNSLSDVSFLSELNQLATLNLWGNTITDISPLSGLPQLTFLDIGSNNISDISPLSGLTQLRSLELSDNSISDISPLSGLPQLTNLSLWNNSISDISPLSGLTQLTNLRLWNNSISDISPLSGLPQLTFLYLGGSNISDISSLSGLTQLTNLGLGSNNISDISSLSGLTQLRSLELGGNSISDVLPLSGLTQLTNLSLWNNSISDISPLSGLTQLTVLNLQGNAIFDISPLVELSLTGTQWDSTGLYIQGNSLNYASLNTHIPTMQAKGVEVQFDQRTPTTLVKISGTAQEGITNTVLPLPFVVEVRDQQHKAFAGVPVTFRVTAGGGKLSAATTETDAAGRAKTHLTLGRTPGTNTVRVTATEISQPAEFTAIGTRLTASVAIPDTNLRTRIAEALGKAEGYTITVGDMLRLTELTANNANIFDLTGLQQASNLTTLVLDDNTISDIPLLAGLPRLTKLSLNSNNISDIAPVAELTHLETLSIENNNISDVTPLAALTELETLLLENNAILDVAPLEALTELKTLRLRGNLLSYPSLHTVVPAIQAGGATVTVDARVPTTLIKVSGTRGVAGEVLPLIVEVQDEHGFGFAGVPVTFSIIAGGGSLSTVNVITDHTGRAGTTFTLGTTPGKYTVRAGGYRCTAPCQLYPDGY